MIIMGEGEDYNPLMGEPPFLFFFFPPSLSPISDIVPELTVFLWRLPLPNLTYSIDYA